MCDLWIKLPEDNDSVFHVSRLIRHLITTGCDYIVQGQQHVALNNHTKPSSLDHWIRTNVANNQDTAQATNNVVAQLCNTGLFAPVPNLVCPDSNQQCQGIRLVDL